MGKNKLQRYAEIKDFDNVIETGDLPENSNLSFSGKWNELVFGRNAPLILELACGKGDYALALARQYPDCNFIGVDIKGDRIWKAAKLAKEMSLQNVRFIRGRIDHITGFFDEGEIDEIWITFPDPFPKKSRKKRRLTHPLFLARYQQICKPGAFLHLKTDDDQLFTFSREMLESQEIPVEEVICDVHSQPKTGPQELEIQTYYEKLHLNEGKKIKYLRARLK